MASGTLSTRPPADSALVAGHFDEFIQKRLEHTRRQMRLVDVGCNALLMAAVSLFFFIAVALVDQWGFAHGLNLFCRLALWLAWVAAAGTYAWRYIVPPLIRPINPVYAAQTIEHTKPTLKNSLINFLLLRSHPDDIAPVVYKAMEHRAATDLSQMPVEHAVDHRRMIRLSYLLAAAVALFALYVVLSPKNPFTSAARVLFPWASIPAPTRVHIEDIKPGDAVVYRGEPQTISAHIAGLRDGEEVSLYVSTPDGQVVDDRMQMTRNPDDNTYDVRLPPGDGGMQQDTLYRIAAGDATTPQFKLSVRIAPTILVDSVDYHYPAYTDTADRTVKGQGDIRALEGTRVTIHATSNVPIKEAMIDLGCTGNQTPMTVKGQQATYEFRLAFQPDKSWRPKYDQYELRVTDAEGNPDRHPLRYRIDVDRDLPPEVEIVEPQRPEVALSAKEHLKIRVRAIDLDYSLRRVALHAEGASQPVNLPVLLDRMPPDKGFKNTFTREYDFSPEEWSLKPGDTVTYWAEAEDNKEPTRNHSETARRTIKIVDSSSEAKREQQPNDQQSGNGQPQQGGNNGGKGQPGDQGRQGGGEPGQDGKGQQGDSSGGQSGGKGSSDKPASSQTGGGDKGDQSKPTGGKDGKTSASDQNSGGQDDPASSGSDDQGSKKADPNNKADRIKDILNHQQQQEQQNDKPQSGDGSKDNQQQKQDQSSGNQPQDGSKSGGGKQDQNQSGGSKPSSDNNGGGQQPGNSSQGNGSQGQPNQSGSQSGNGSQGNRKQPQGAKGDSASNNGNGSQQNPGGQNGDKPDSAKLNGGNQGNEKSAQQQGGGQGSSSQHAAKEQAPDGEQSQNGSSSGAGNKPDASQSAQHNPGGQNAGGQPKAGDNKTASGSENSGSNSGQGNPESKRDGSKSGQENQSAGGQSLRQKLGGEQQANGGQSNGAPQQNRTGQKPGGSQGSPSSDQMAMNGQKPNNGQSPSGDSNMNMPGGKSGEKPTSKSGPSSGGSEGQQAKESQEKSGGASSGGDQPKQGQGDKPQPGGDKSSSQGTKSDKPGGTSDNNGDARQQTPGNSGDPTQQDSHGSPDRQVGREGQPKSGDANGGTKSDNEQSPSNSKHDSNTSGQSEGDRSGNGGKGGGQPGEKAGTGASGAGQPAGEDGGSVSQKQGPGATGPKAGETTKTSEETGSTRQEASEGGRTTTQPTNDQSQPQSQPRQEAGPTQNRSPSNEQTSSGQPGGQSATQAGKQGVGQPSGGSPSNGTDAVEAPPQERRPAGEDPADLEFSKKQVDMALRHLKDEMKKPKPELLDKLGWTKDEAEQFVKNIEKMRDAAGQPGKQGTAGNKDYNEFLKDLGLRPHGTRLSGTTPKDALHGVRDAGQVAPPAEWAEQTREYSQSTAGEK